MLARVRCPLESGHKNAGDALRVFNETKAELEANGCGMLGDLTFSGQRQVRPADDR